MFARSIIFCIRVYQGYFSPDHSPSGKLKYPYGFCKYHPTCSMYAIAVIQKYGVVIGVAKATYRVLRCNPCSRGGVDLP
jgi:putative membrane protein insertion efficiency factor